jgi:hypothetical protein
MILSGTFLPSGRLPGPKPPAVWRWQERYIEEGIEGLLRDKTRPSRIPPLSDAVKLAVLTKTATEEPADATHWSRASMAEAIGISPSSVGRIWAEAALKPHLVKRFKISNDPQFKEKVTDIVGLYLNPPERAVVLSVDEKSQIQALDRTQPGLPLKKGRAATMTHDYKRHGNHAVCGPRREERPRHRRMPAAAPGARVSPVPAPHRTQSIPASRFTSRRPAPPGSTSVERFFPRL